MKTFGQFIWSLYYALRERDNLFSYLKENRRYLDCEIFPSKQLMKRYKLGDHADFMVWSILEKHIEGEKQRQNEIQLKEKGYYKNDQGEIVITPEVAEAMRKHSIFTL